MRTLRLPAAALALVLVSVAAPAWAQDTAGSSGQATKGGEKGAKGADAEFHHGMVTMQHEMSNMKMTGNPDRDFVMMMIPHHRGAVEMAKVELRYGKDPELKKLAQNIIKSQDEEISFMEDWQRKQSK